jgi:hypothetical protein
MKTMRFFALAALMMAATAVSAQNKVVTLDQQMKNKKTTTTTKTTTTKKTTPAKTTTTKTTAPKATSVGSLAGWQSFYVQYNPLDMHFSSDGFSANSGFSAITAGWNQAMPIAGATPLFFQYGVGIQYGWDSNDGEKATLLSAKIPLNLVYSFQLPGTSVSLDPYAGIYGRAFIIGKSSYEGESWNYFSEDDMGEGNTWNRFQLGAQFGINVNFSQFYAGIGYGMDILEVTDDTTIRGLDITLGMKF